MPHVSLRVSIDIAGGFCETPTALAYEIASVPLFKVRERVGKLSDSEQLQEVVCCVIAQELELPRDLVRPDSHLELDLGVDSLAAIRIGVELESRFDLIIPEEFTMQTVADVIRYVEEQIGSAREPG